MLFLNALLLVLFFAGNICIEAIRCAAVLGKKIKRSS
jgi:hypothetical protein